MNFIDCIRKSMPLIAIEALLEARGNRALASEIIHNAGGWGDCGPAVSDCRLWLDRTVPRESGVVLLMGQYGSRPRWIKIYPSEHDYEQRHAREAIERLNSGHSDGGMGFLKDVLDGSPICLEIGELEATFRAFDRYGIGYHPPIIPVDESNVPEICRVIIGRPRSVCIDSIQKWGISSIWPEDREATIEFANRMGLAIDC